MLRCCFNLFSVMLVEMILNLIRVPQIHKEPMLLCLNWISKFLDGFRVTESPDSHQQIILRHVGYLTFWDFLGNLEVLVLGLENLCLPAMQKVQMSRSLIQLSPVLEIVRLQKPCTFTNFPEFELFHLQRETWETAISAWEDPQVTALCWHSSDMAIAFLQSFQLILTRTKKPITVNLTSGEYCKLIPRWNRGKSISIARKGNKQAAAEKILKI